MSIAPTAAAIIRALERHRFHSEMGLLAALDSTHSEAVRAALAAVPPRSRIDVPVLLESVRRKVAEREAKRPPGQPWRYAITLMTDEQLEEFRRLAQLGNDPDTAAQSAMSTCPRSCRHTRGDRRASRC